MSKNTLKYEWITLMRDRWILILILLFFSITFFAIRNGNEKVHERTISIARERDKVEKIDARVAAEIDSVDRKLKALPKESWLDPRSLINVAWDGPRVVAMEPSPFAIIATGQSDLFTHYAKPKIYGEAYTLGFSELSNPVQLLFGSFDLAFVCIYLLPLLVLAFCYNILSAEKESGVLRLTFSQPVSIYQWLLNKLLFRFVIISVIVILSITLALLIYNVNVIGHFGSFFKLMSILLAYILFWFMVALIVNLFGKSSGSNAVLVVCVWLTLVLLVPSVISQLATSLNPVPSRIHMIHEYRVASAEANKRADEILKNYLRDHPELAPKDTTKENQYAWILGYFASSEIVEQSVRPILNQYDDALAKQQAWVNNLRFLSPALLIQSGFNEIAGTSTAHYADFRKQVIQFADVWKGYFKPRMFAGELMKADEVASLPKHRYSTQNISNHYEADLIGVVFFLLVTGLGSWMIYRRGSSENVLSV
jgi:ABC-2 type transport system permease protein